MKSPQHQARLTWLQEHDDILDQLPGIADDVEPVQSRLLIDVTKLMTDAKLFSKGNQEQIRWNIRKLVSEIRGQGLPRKRW
jgi:hypothetical protein